MKEIIGRCGWSDRTVIKLMEQFLEENGLEEDFVLFLEEIEYQEKSLEDELRESSDDEDEDDDENYEEE